MDENRSVEGVLQAGSIDWKCLNKAMRCKGAGQFGALQLAKDLLDAPRFVSLASASTQNLETWYPVESCPGTLRGLRRL